MGMSKSRSVNNRFTDVCSLHLPSLEYRVGQPKQGDHRNASIHNPVTGLQTGVLVTAAHGQSDKVLLTSKTFR